VGRGAYTVVRTVVVAGSPVVTVVWMGLASTVMVDVFEVVLVSVLVRGLALPEHGKGYIDVQYCVAR